MRPVSLPTRHTPQKHQVQVQNSAKYPPDSRVISFRVSESHLRFCVCLSEKQWEYASFLATAFTLKQKIFHDARS